MQAGPVIEKLAERITDSDTQVRRQLRGLLAEHVLPHVAGPALSPFLPLLMAFVCSALTQLSPDVR